MPPPSGAGRDSGGEAEDNRELERDLCALVDPAEAPVIAVHRE
jgi:hypothetical protein